MIDPFKIKSSKKEEPFVLHAETLVENPFAALEDKADPTIPTATLQIYEHINEALARPKVATYVNRASSAPMCLKRRWYQRRGVEGAPLTPRKEVNFLLGDLSERVILHFIAQGCVGPGKLYSKVHLGEALGSIHFQGKELFIYKQQTLSVNVAGVGDITAHADGWGLRNSDNKWELIECKSAANWGFNDFKKIGPKDYLKQAMTCLSTDYAREIGADGVRYFYIRKETGHLWDQFHKLDPFLWAEVMDEFRAVQSDTEPRAPYPIVDELYRNKPTGRRVVSFPCSYCPYLEQCKGKYTVDWKSNQYGHLTPVYVFGETQ